MMFVIDCHGDNIVKPALICVSIGLSAKKINCMGVVRWAPRQLPFHKTVKLHKVAPKSHTGLAVIFGPCVYAPA